MKKSFLFLMIMILSFSVFSQKSYRARAGYLENVSIDSTTPLIVLVGKLEEAWDFIETGKAYWIGYTDNMYSIACYNDKAINILVDFIENTESLRGRIGALYTLHLIGIKCHIVGRFHEAFLDTLARKAIISYLNDPDLHETVVFLLMRDPWETDLPYLMEYLSKTDKDYSKLLSALQRYGFKNKPFGQNLPKEMTSREIEVKTVEQYSRQPIEDMLALKHALGDSILIDNEILSSQEWIESELSLKSGSVKSEYQRIGTLIENLSNSTFSYCTFSNRFFYVYQDNIIHIYGPTRAREIWLDWWSNLNDDKR
jgi:hypothetical protein